MTEHVRQFVPARWRARLADLRGRGVYAGYADRWRCVFIHVPKTAGSSVARALFGAESRHVPYVEYETANPGKFHAYFKFAFVRNPWDRLVSAYFFLRDGGMNAVDGEWSTRHMAHHDNFGEFVRNGLSDRAIADFPHFLPQSHFIADARGQVMVDFVGRYENLAGDFGSIARRLGLACPLPRSNESRHAHYTTYYDSETRDLVGRLYARDTYIFGYRFDG